MAFTHKVGITYNDDAGTVSSTTASYTGNTEASFSGTVANDSSPHEIDVAAIKTNIQSLCLYSDQALTLKTNSSSSPADTIVLVAKQALIWPSTLSGGGTNPFSVDVTKIYAVNAAGAPANVKISILTNL